jgi:hypothetical protein
MARIRASPAWPPSADSAPSDRADGRSDGETAAELFISKKTASAHVAHIKNKLGVESRVEIAVAAIRSGLVEPLTVGRRLPAVAAPDHPR